MGVFCMNDRPNFCKETENLSTLEMSHNVNHDISHIYKIPLLTQWHTKTLNVLKEIPISRHGKLDFYTGFIYEHMMWNLKSSGNNAYLKTILEWNIFALIHAIVLFQCLPLVGFTDFVFISEKQLSMEASSTSAAMPEPMIWKKTQLCVSIDCLLSVSCCISPALQSRQLHTDHTVSVSSKLLNSAVNMYWIINTKQRCLQEAHQVLLTWSPDFVSLSGVSHQFMFSL